MIRIKDKSGQVRFVSDKTANRLVGNKEAIRYTEADEIREAISKAPEKPVANKMVDKPKKKKSSKKSTKKKKG